MKKLVMYLLVMFFTNTIFSQEWFTNFSKAKEQAVATNKNIVLVFQGSDWCAPCIKLDKEIWSTETYKKLAKDHFIMVKADFPRKKANKLTEEIQNQNNALAAKYNAQGYFPLAVVLTPSGNVLGKLGYEHITPEAYFKKLTDFEK